MPKVIDLKNIIKSYRIANTEQKVLNGVNFYVEEGEMVAIIGASGSGKTTLMNTIGLLDKPDSGSYLINGQDALGLSEDERADLRNRTIGFVFQQFMLLPRLTLLENVGLPLRYRDMNKAEIEKLSLEMLKRVGLDHLADHKPNQLSGGQQQRVAIARALVGKPLVVLADEPTGSLDFATTKVVMDFLIELNKKDKVTMVIVTHAADIAAQCQRIFRIEQETK